MFLADKKALDEPYTYAIKQSDLTRFLRERNEAVETHEKAIALSARLDELKTLNRLWDVENDCSAINHVTAAWIADRINIVDKEIAELQAVRKALESKDG